MALELKVKYAVTIDATSIRVEDVTGQYSVSNPTGWGAPNPLLSERALFSVVVRKTSAADEFLVPSSVQVVYDNTASNDKITTFDFSYTTDSVFEIWLGMLRVSTDDINYVDGGAISTGDFYYYNGKVWRRTGTSSEEITNINSLIQYEGDIVFAKRMDILLPKLALIKASLYKQYVLLRDKKCDYKNIWSELLELSQDIQGAIYAFYSGLANQAVSMVESMLKRYELET